MAWLSTWLRFSSSMAAARLAASVLTCSARLVSCTPSGDSSAITDADLQRAVDQPVRFDDLADQTAAVGFLGADTVRPVSIQSAATLVPTIRGR